ncbi:hypothetical protein BT63DRAFT_425287 [Microthyrium microscopicum]|uniref:DUF6594 domain-containing protein n=1 Tax=Microthyrium microscopicum TaxID=703497 RepID=A0A6A6UDG1_9PEZI|nr:hypothetical protein BT63DRAFT_425287 [Microthyrium microscopicum]
MHTSVPQDQPPMPLLRTSTSMENSAGTATLDHPSDLRSTANTSTVKDISAQTISPGTPNNLADFQPTPGSHDKSAILEDQQKAIYKECTSTAHDDKWNIRRFEQLSFISLYNTHLEIMTLEAEIDDTKGVMPQKTQERLRNLLQSYSEAVRNIEYMTKFPTLRFDLAFNRSNTLFPCVQPKMADSFDYCNFRPASLAVDQVRSFLQKILPQKLVLGDASLFYKLYKRRANEVPRPKQLSPIVDGFARIIVAITGGVFLLVPMIIMTWVTNAHIRLIIVSVAVLWFAISIAVTSKATNQELMGATAAYTAVLVVYIGTTSSSTGN